MKKIVTYFLFLLCLLCFGCKQKHSVDAVNTDITVHSVDLDKAGKVYASEIFDSIVYVPLETTDVALLGRITKMEIADSLFFLLDKQTHTIWCFDQKGKYINHIHRLGQGPEEYVSIFDFTVDIADNLIAVLDRNTKKILWYTFSGKFVKSRRIEVSAMRFGLLNDNKILAYTNGADFYMKGGNASLAYNYFIIDSVDKITAYFPHNEMTDNLLGIKIIEINDGKVLATYAANDTVYEFSRDGELILKHVIDFRNNSQYAHRDAVYYSDNYTLLTYTHENRARFILRNNKTDKSIIGNFLENDIDFISLANPEPVKIQDNRIYYLKDVDFITKQKRDGKPVYPNIPALSVLKNEDNPVLLIGYLKF
jgi:hypothetical protein